MAWQEARPDWQSHALRLVFLHHRRSHAQLDEVLVPLKQEYGLAVEAGDRVRAVRAGSDARGGPCCPLTRSDICSLEHPSKSAAPTHIRPRTHAPAGLSEHALADRTICSSDTGAARGVANERGMNAQEKPSFGLHPRLSLFDGLPVPVCLVDGECHLVDMNRSALSFWGVELGEVLGQPAIPTLGIVPSDGGGDAWRRISPPAAHPRLPCRITTAAGQVRPGVLIYTPLGGATPPVGALFIIEGAMVEVLTDVPDWALRDPVTGLGNRHLWEREAAAWASRSGCVVFLDLDDLKEVNDLHGHVAGDRLLAAAGQTLACLVPAAALTVRYGGDEFVAVLADPDEAAAEAWAQEAVRRVADASADLPIVPRLSHGIAAFGPGGLPQAVQRADDVLYQRKGMLLPAASGGRIILTREGRAALRAPGDERVRPRPGAFGAGFGPEFEDYLRAQYARALEQAQELVAFVDPEPGSAVIEVGAGSGRITFGGGLAERIGHQGQLLVTDPSGGQLLAARKHAEELGLDWVRFLRAPAEELPLASGTADLAIGAFFLQFTHPEEALRELARVIRPGGAVAIGAGLAFAWPPAWQEILAPVREELERHHLPLGHVFSTETTLRRWMGDAGLRVKKVSRVGPEHIDFPRAEIAIAFWGQNGLVPLLLRGVPAERHAHIQEAFDARLRDVFDRTVPRNRRIVLEAINVVAQKPG